MERTNSGHPARTVATLALMNAAFSAVVPVVADALGKPLSSGENFILGVLLFCAGALLEVLYYLAQIRQRASREDAAWDSHEEIDAKLTSMRKSMRTLEMGVEPDCDLFLRYFKSRIISLEYDLRQTAGSRELRVDSENLDLAAPLLESFAGLPTDKLRIVHFFADNDALFNVHEAQWFYKVVDAVDKSRISEVRRLLVFDELEQISDPKSVRLMAFLKHAKGFDFRVVSRSDFDRLAKSFKLQGEFVDFGIYGQRYLFKGLLYESDDLVGVYSRDEDEIMRYIKFFDFCWDSPTSKNKQLPELAPVTIDGLFV